MRSRFEIRAQKELEKDGYFVDYKIRSSFPIKGYNTDYFNRFDLLTFKEGEPLRWISIKGKTGNYMENRKSILEFKMPSGNQKEQWRYDREPKNRRKIRVRKEIIP